MSHLLTPAYYNVPKTSVAFSTFDAALQAVYNRCEELCLSNLDRFGDKIVLKEGAKYNGVWLETQPMGGEMYAARNAEAALGNHLIFMEYQRRDGRMPGMITCRMPWSGLAVHFDWMQGNFFSISALRMYYIIGEDKNYLELLYNSLRDYDNYLWTYRDSDGDGCLETWCMWDTGDDNNTRFMSEGVHAVNNGAFSGENPPEGPGLPFESAEYMAYSYSMRTILAEICDILGRQDEAAQWRIKADAVQAKVREYLWDDERGAVYDRDRDNRMLYCLSLANIKCMYHGLFTQEMADTFVSRHLMAKNEFFTPLPLPNIAANDPLYYVSEKQNNCSERVMEIIRKNMAGDTLDNSWSGPAQGLSFQRSLDALLRYGHHAEATLIGRAWLENHKRFGKYVQQYDPADGTPLGQMEGYGPTLLGTLEYIAYLRGVDYVSGRLIWNSDVSPDDSDYTQTIGDHVYRLIRESGKATAYIDGREIFTMSDGFRVVTGTDGYVITISCLNDRPTSLSISINGAVYEAIAAPNESFIIEKGRLCPAFSAPFTPPHG